MVCVSKLSVRRAVGPGPAGCRGPCRGAAVGRAVGFPVRLVLRQLVPRTVGARRSEGGRSSERPTERDVGERRGAVGPGSEGSSDFSSSSRRKRKMKKRQGDRGTIARGEVRSKWWPGRAMVSECRNRTAEPSGTRAVEASQGWRRAGTGGAETQNPRPVLGSGALCCWFSALELMQGRVTGTVPRAQPCFLRGAPALPAVFAP